MTADVSEAEPSPGAVVRSLLRTQGRAALGTIDGHGAPYVSLVMIAVDHDAAPLLLLSDLAEHTQNAGHDDRVSLLVDGTCGLATPLTGARATLMGRLEPATAAQQRERYLARHEDARGYAAFGDFNFYRMAIERAHLVAGFGRIHWVSAENLLWPMADALPLAAAEAEIVQHMNEDHADALALYATALLGHPAGEWRLVGVDPEGADLANQDERVRLWFDKPARDADSARVELVRLVKRARQGSQVID